MTIEKLTIQNFRNLTDVQIMPGPQFNLFYGENGSGKTSLLESLYYLSTGRSFRTRLVHHLFKKDTSRFLIAAEYNHIPIGIERFNNGEYHVRIRKEETTIAELAKLLPAQFFNHDIYLLVSGGPEYKRQFIDWGVFHVERADPFLSLWRQYKEVLRQRNAALKKRSVEKRQVTLWNMELTKSAEPITAWREEYVRHLIPSLREILQKLLEDVTEIEFKFFPGWDMEYSLEEALQKNFEKDLAIGFTEFGPHRADLRISVKGMHLEEVLSRGQQKLFACAMRLAQAFGLQEKTQKPCIFLLDDLSAELDNIRLAKICDLLTELKAQIFFTSTQQHLFNDFFPSHLVKKFHVEHGQIKEIL